MWFTSLILLCALLVLPAVTQAGTATATYTEPTTAIDGSPLSDLTQTTLYWKQDAGAEQKLVVPATKPQGGGAITKTFAYVSPGPCASTTLSAQVTASNAKESTRSPLVTSTRTGTPPPGDSTCSAPVGPGSVTLTLGP